MVEKPPVDEAPSDLIIIGRYVLTPDVFDEIATGRIGALGEIQLTDALRAQAAPVAVPRRGQPHRPLRHRHAARLPHGGDRAGPARPAATATSCGRSSTACSPPASPDVRALDPTRRRRDARGRITAGAEAAGVVDDEAVARRRRTRRRVVASTPARRQRRSPRRSYRRCAGDRRRASRRRRRSTGSSAASPTSSGQPPDRQRGRERRAGQVDVAAAVELGAVGAVDLAPPGVPVGGQPQVGLLEVAEQQELAHPPRRRQPQRRTGPAPGRPGRSPSTPRSPSAASGAPSCSPSHVSQRTSWPSAENARQALIGPVKWPRPVEARPTVLATVHRVIDLEDAQRFVLEACPPLAPVAWPRRRARAGARRRRRGRRGRAAVRQLGRRRLRRAGRRPRRGAGRAAPSSASWPPARRRSRRASARARRCAS